MASKSIIRIPGDTKPSVGLAMLLIVYIFNFVVLNSEMASAGMEGLQEFMVFPDNLDDILERLEETARVLIGQDADDQGQRARGLRLSLGKNIGEGPGGVGIVAPIQPYFARSNQRSRLEQLQTCRPARRPDAVGDGFF